MARSTNIMGYGATNRNRYGYRFRRTQEVAGQMLQTGALQEEAQFAVSSDSDSAAKKLIADQRKMEQAMDKLGLADKKQRLSRIDKERRQKKRQALKVYLNGLLPFTASKAVSRRLSFDGASSGAEKVGSMHIAGVGLLMSEESEAKKAAMDIDT